MSETTYVKQWQGNISNNILSGILLALALLPGAIAFSLIAGVSPTIGLISTGLMMLVISVTGNRTLMVSAPSSGVSLVVAPLAASHGLQALIMATIFMGTIQIILGYCNINKLLDLIPLGVVIGFMNALGILLFTSQLKNIFNISIETYMITIVSFFFIWIVPKFIKIIPAPLIAIVILTVFAWVFKPNIKVVSDMAPIHIKIPQPSIPKDIWEWHFLMITFVYGVTMAIVAIVQTTLTARMMDDVTVSKSDKNKESIGQGIANFIVGILGGYGGSALVGQSRFNVSMGASSRLSTFITGSFLLVSIFIFGAIIGQIPMAVLSTVLITISLNTFDRRTIPFIKHAPILNGSIVILTFVIILITNNLAVGVVLVTIGYYIVNNLKKKGSDT
ncbi:SulP family inorganic anion transporter [Staphylococcus succinus]|uniref:SulP family inorganic anion transporter n=1 Tax=Staphylococcus succinus TaxID=61015 RepID=A0A9Q6MVC1_9STAP|nr:SulP family inorganic anion transporter [Staphylococcus succinus]MEB8127096.1 SulP family inorganic anion transporter [Staphylococcus succinus]PTI41515.1 SulP family inorganic anion transporter [Staphylococcus succinus]PTI75485.1 SulP family inorganic anion transporter [Staphylococcus succinus]RIN28570.1 SulP family inorganic anion transporter [Staphylococcus succinus]RIN37340.1 SulP family inorganic anion transporter [Staphylococcus succinus]